MPFRSENPIVRVEIDSMHTIDTSNVENLFGLWSIFSKCAETMEHGKRLENLSWRLWNRETFCCAPESTSSRWRLSRKHSQDGSTAPELSSSVESDSSSCTSTSAASRSDFSRVRPELRRNDSAESYNRGRAKHLTPIDLEKYVISIKEKQELCPLSPLPRSVSCVCPPDSVVQPKSRPEDTTPRPTSPRPTSQIVPESSTSTVATVADSETSTMSPTVASEASTSTDLSSHSVVVRGFTLGRVSSSFRSKTNLAAPQPVINTPCPHKADGPKKKGATFTLGGSSDEGGESSLETHINVAHKASPLQRSSLSDALRRPVTSRKKASFKLGSDNTTLLSEDDEGTGSDAIVDSDEEPSESAIEDDDDEEWLSEEEDESNPASDTVSFQRIDSRPNLVSRRSLIATQLTERGRAKALQNEASRSTPALRRSRTTSPNGPSVPSSPKEDAPILEPQGLRIPSRPAIMTTSNTQTGPSALSPRTTRRNMLSTELTESLRRNLLWERQQKNATSNAALKRRHTSNDVKNLRQFPGEGRPTPLAPIRENNKNNNSWNAYFDHGLQEYHQKGW